MVTSKADGGLAASGASERRNEQDMKNGFRSRKMVALPPLKLSSSSTRKTALRSYVYIFYAYADEAMLREIAI